MMELIERLEALDGTDRNVDAALARLDGWQEIANNGTWAKDYGGEVGVRYLISAPNFTGSLDAALTLVPEGHGAVSGSMSTLGSSFRIEKPYAFGNAKLPAIALCIAALRARMSKGG
jgi:hypothetical protein